MGSLCAAKEVVVYERSLEDWSAFGGPAWKYPTGDIQAVTKITDVNGEPKFEFAPQTMGEMTSNWVQQTHNLR